MAVYPGCPDEDNYHTTELGDCYYIPDIDGSLKIGTWSEAFEFLQSNFPEHVDHWLTTGGTHADKPMAEGDRR